VITSSCQASSCNTGFPFIGLYYYLLSSRDDKFRILHEGIYQYFNLDTPLSFFSLRSKTPKEFLTILICCEPCQKSSINLTAYRMARKRYQQNSLEYKTPLQLLSSAIFIPLQSGNGDHYKACCCIIQGRMIHRLSEVLFKRILQHHNYLKNRGSRLT